MKWAFPGDVPRISARVILLSLLLGALALLAVPLAFAAEPGQALFEQKCSTCHTIGGGKAVGPDLKGVADRHDRAWLISFILAPDRVVASGDAAAKQLVQQYGMTMPALGLTTQEVDQIMAYLGVGAGGKSAPPAGQEAKKASAAPPGDVAIGRELFTGSVRFANGGVACVSCHDAQGVGALGGGSVGKDLTTAFATFGADGLRSIVQTTPFPIMREAFADHKLTEAEVSHVVAFLQGASEGAKGAQADSAAWLIFAALGVAGIVVFLVLFQFIWMGRLQGVRQSLVKGGSR